MAPTSGATVPAGNGGHRRRAPSSGTLLRIGALVLMMSGSIVLGTQLMAGGGKGGGPVELGAETPATAMNSVLAPANNSPMLRADPTNARFVVLSNRVDAPDYTCSLLASGDSGATWAPVTPVPVLPEGAEKCFGGEVAFDGRGRLYVLFLGLAGAGNEPMGAFLTTSNDRGRTFSAPQRVLGPLNFAVRMAVDPTMGAQGRIHLVWLHATTDPPAGGFGPPPNPVLSAYSDDGGATFSEPVQVNEPARQRVLAPALALGDDHRVHVAYYDLRDDARDYQALEGPVWEGTWSLVVASSDDGGRTFGPGVEVEPEVTPHERVIAAYIMPPPALDARGSRVCTAWPDARHGDPDVFARCSGDRGRRWAGAVRLHDDAVGNGYWQYMPGIAIAPGGRVDAIFYDRRDDPENVYNDVRYTYSTDGGETFSQGAKLNRSGPSVSMAGQQYLLASAEGLYDFGARMALLSRRHDVVAAWTDTRNSSPGSTAQDIFTTTARPPDRAGGARPPVVASGGILLVAGVGCLLLSRRRRSSTSPAGRSPAGAGVLIAGLLASSCTARSAEPGYLPAPTPVVTVAMSDFGFDVRGALPAGRVIFRLTAVGEATHSVFLAPLDEEASPIAEYLLDIDRPAIGGFANVSEVAPGQTGAFAVDLEPGRRYALICTSRAPNGHIHAELGETWEARAVAQ